MSENKLEQDLQSKEVEIGEWFNPFESYSKTGINPGGKQLDYKIFNFSVRGVGPFRCLTSWDNSTTLVDILSIHFDRDDLVSPENPENKDIYERDIEKKLMYIDIEEINPKHTGKRLPYRVEMKTPSGNVYSSNLEPILGWETEPPSTDNWHSKGSDKKISLIAAPDTERVFGKIQMRIVPIQGGEN